MTMTSFERSFVLACMLLPACADGRIVPIDDDGTTGSTAVGTSSTTTVAPTDGATVATMATAADGTTGTTGTTGAGGDDVPFVAQPDLGDDARCDIYAQNCPPGDKCMPASVSGAPYWEARVCRPVVDDPVGIGEPCHTEGDQFSGIDDCELGAMCWAVDLVNLEGTCVPFCVGSSAHATCEDPDRACTSSSNAAMEYVLCLPICDPLGSDCEPGKGCYPIMGWWSCGPDDSGDLGTYGDPCGFVNECDPGLLCLGSSALPPGLPCEGSLGCCAEVCDLFDQRGDAQCMGVLEGVTCQPWFDPEQTPPGYEDVGVCALPQT